MGKHDVGTAALRELAGGAGQSGDGPVEICMREADFQVIEVNRPEGGTMPAPANAKVAFTVQAFRELRVDGEPSGLWEFTIAISTGSEPVRGRVFVDGADIFYVKVQSRIL